MALSDYEDALKSYILDDDKLVTYKWLSKEFEVHVNVAKDLLKQYWKKNKNEEDITATFLLVGQLKNGSIRIEVVKEENLSAAREKFVKIDCEHLYSLQKSLEDIELLALTDGGDLRFSAIKCNEEYVRSNEEINSLRYVGNTRKEDDKSANKVPEKQVPKQVDSSSKDKTNNLMYKKVDNKTEKDEVPKAEQKRTESKTEAEKSQSTEKKVSPKNNVKDTSKINNKVSKKPVQSKKSGFNNLFGKVPSKPQPSDNLKEDSDDGKTRKTEKMQLSREKDDEKNEQEKEKNKGIDSLGKENKIQQSEVKSKVVTKTGIQETKSKSKKDVRGKKRNKSQEKDIPASKRKRIVVMDSSEDESDKSIDEEEEPMEIVEEPIKVARKRSPSPPAEKRENGKRMVSKYIDKTYKDEDGFLVTKRVQVYEAVSDNEEPEVVKAAEEPKKPADTKAKKKQTTLTNFFKKS